MTDSKKVSIIIVNWNGRKFLRACLSSLHRQTYRNAEIIFVDNASTDGSVSYVKRYFPWVKIIVNNRNLGFAEANNIGYERSCGKYVLFLNNDTKVTPNFLTNLLTAFKKDKTIGGAQSKILFMDKEGTLDTVGSFLTSNGFLYHYGFAKKDSQMYEKTIDIYSAKGACMFFRRDVLEKVKVDGEIFDKHYFAYFEETDLCHRVWMAGYRIIFVPNSIIYHKVGATSSQMANSFVQYHSFKNRINSFLKNFGSKTLLTTLPLHLVLCEAISLIYLTRGKIGIAWAINKAILWNIINLMQTFRKKHFIQHCIRRVEDRVFWPTISKDVRSSYYFYTFLGTLDRYKEKSP